MHARLHRLHSPDATDLEQYQPPDAEHSGLLVQAMIGPEGQPGEESFDFLVCTPSWLAAVFRDKRYVFGRHYLFLPQYDYAVLEQALRQVCEQAVGENWQAVAANLSRYGKWEFEDYKGTI